MLRNTSASIEIGQKNTSRLLSALLLNHAFDFGVETPTGAIDSGGFRRFYLTTGCQSRYEGGGGILLDSSISDS